MTGTSLWNDEPDFPQTSAPRIPPPNNASPKIHRLGNVFQHLARREVSPRSAHFSKRSLKETSKCDADSSGSRSRPARDPRHGLVSWVESESLSYLSAKYCRLLPPPRSTIAAAFSPDGKRLASTHGDHTVKIIDCHTGKCLKVLSGHRRTPWVVRFHPLLPDILASGSLDHEVRLWDARTAECIASRDFYRPIASLAFHAQGELLAVASGHKLYIWQYKKTGVTSPPSIVLRTQRSLRAVHFHPRAAPFLLTAEVNDLDSADSSMTFATSPSYLHYPAPTVYLTDARSSESPTLTDGAPLLSLPYLMWPSSRAQHIDTEDVSALVRPRVDISASVRLLTYSTPSGHYELLLSPIVPGDPSPTSEEVGAISRSSEMETEVSQSAVNTLDAVEAQPDQGRTNSGFPTYWELPFLQGWLMGHTQAGQHSRHPLNTNTEETSAHNETSPSVNPNRAGFSRVIERPQSRNRTSRSHSIPVAALTDNATSNISVHGDGHPQPVSRIQQELATSFGVGAAAAELPCTVKLRLWSHHVKNPCVPLHPDVCRLTIPHAVLCSEMGAHFSPCGRYLAACVACVLPHSEAEPGLQSQVSHDIPGLATSPTRHPLSAHQVVYELRIYSLVEATFGFIIASRAIRAAHCLTSIQFSPTSEHILLAYGRRHSSLLKSVVINGEATVPIYTILEVYRVCDMELVRVLPSAEDEVNVACFHPSPGGGIVYGTKEGRLRILQFDRSHIQNNSSHGLLDEEMFELPTHALEC